MGWCGRAVLGAVAAVVLGLLAAPLLVDVEAQLPLKLRVGVAMLGWQGVFRVAAENAATRLLGTKTTSSREAYHNMLAVLADANLKHLSAERAIVDPDDIAEGQLLAVHIMTTAIEQYIFVDPAHPELRPLVDKDHKWGGDNPDVKYYSCVLNASLDYVITGRRTTETYLSFTVYTADTLGGLPNGTVSDINDQRMVFSSDGSYTITLSSSKPNADENANAANWLSLASTGHLSLVSRHYFENVKVASADRSLHVDVDIRTAVPQPPPSRPSDADLARKFAAIATSVAANTYGRDKPDPANTPPWFSLTPNVMGKPDMHQQKFGKKTGGFGAPDIAYGAGPWKLQPDEALVVTGRFPRCVFANVNLWNRFLQTLSFQHRQVSLNRNQIKYNADGSYTLVIAHSNPGPAHNWLDTEGRETGTIFWRFVLHEGELQAPEARVVKFDSLL